MRNARVLRNMYVIEGPDSIGKSSICSIIREKLLADGINSTIVKFPNYESVTSRIIEDYLTHRIDIHIPDALHRAKTISNVYSTDRAITLNGAPPDGMSLYERMISSPDEVFIVDRYTQSNIIHQTIDLPEDDLFEFGKWLFDLEFNSLRLPVPFASLYLIPDTIEVIFRNITNRPGKRDILETDERIVKTYDALINSRAVKDLLYQTFPSKENIKVDIRLEDSIDAVSNMVYKTIKKLYDERI